jgi:hypothetical protein
LDPCIHDVLVNAVGACRFGVVSVNVFNEDIPKKGASFDEALLVRHDNDVIVVTGSMVASHDAFLVRLLFQYAILQIR